eukprot:61742-Chlamydomonas_euryale.AAC.1
MPHMLQKSNGHAKARVPQIFTPRCPARWSACCAAFSSGRRANSGCARTASSTASAASAYRPSA